MNIRRVLRQPNRIGFIQTQKSRKFRHALTFILLYLGFFLQAGLSQTQHFALIVSGASGDKEFSEKFRTWSSQLIATLQTDFAYPPTHVFFLTEDPEYALNSGGVRATKLQLRAGLDRIRQSLHKNDLLLIVLLGHATVDGDEYKFNLVGPDVSGTELRSWLESFSNQELVLIIATPCSGGLLKQLADKNRILITATKSEFENNDVIFPEFVVEALSQKKADRNKDSRVSIFEVFQYAAQMTASWYKSRGLLATEHPVMEDSGNQRVTADLSPGDGAELQASSLFIDYPAFLAEPEKLDMTRNTEIQSLYRKKRQIEDSLQQLKKEKANLSEVDYSNRLEYLLIQLAQTNQKLRQAGKQAHP